MHFTEAVVADYRTHYRPDASIPAALQELKAAAAGQAVWAGKTNRSDDLLDLPSLGIRLIVRHDCGRQVATQLVRLGEPEQPRDARPISDNETSELEVDDNGLGHLLDFVRARARRGDHSARRCLQRAGYSVHPRDR